ncbi:MAG: hypothetical protein ACMXYE_01570 [Candidatus Woesearchaeota archaeon]
MHIVLANPKTIEYWEHQNTSESMIEKALEELIDPEDEDRKREKIAEYLAGDVDLYLSEPNYGWRNIPPLPLIRSEHNGSVQLFPYNGHHRRASAIHAGIPVIGGYLLENDDDLIFLKQTEEFNPNIGYAGRNSLEKHIQIILEVASRIKEHPLVYS